MWRCPPRPWGAVGGRLQWRLLLLCEPSLEPAMRPASPRTCSDPRFWVLQVHLSRSLSRFSPLLHTLWVELSRSCAAASFRLCVAPSGGGSFRVGYDIDPLRVRRGLGVVVVVPVPPLVRRGLEVTLWRILPGFLTAERRDIEVAPGGPHRLVATVVDEVCAEHPLAIAEEHVVTVPLTDAEIHIEAVGDGVPGHLPAHPRLQARDVRLWRA